MRLMNWLPMLSTLLGFRLGKMCAYTCPGVHTHRHTNESPASNHTCKAVFKAASLTALEISPRERETGPTVPPTPGGQLDLFIFSASFHVPF